MALVSQTFKITAAADAVRRSIDPFGNFGASGNDLVATVAPVVSLSSSIDQTVAVGNTYTATFTSTEAGHWDIKAGFDGYTVAVSADSLSATITWVTPATMPGESFHVTAKCHNFGGESFNFDRVHVGVNAVLFAGAGKTYADLEAAFAAMSSGDTIVLSDGTYTGDSNNVIRLDGFTATQIRLPLSGIYTTDNSGADPVQAITCYTTVMSESPFGVLIDKQGLSGTGIELIGNTPLESYELNTEGWSSGHLIAAGTDRRGIKLAGFVVKDSQSTGIWVMQCDHIKLQYCLAFENGVGFVSGANSVTNISIQNSTDCLVEYAFGFGEGRYKVSTYQSKRIVVRRGFARQDQREGADPMAAVNLYRERQSACQNYLHIDSDSFEFWDAAGTSGNISFGFAATGVYGYPKDGKFDRVGSLNNECGFIFNDAYENPNDYQGFLFKDVWAHDIEVPQNSFCQNGPMRIENFTFSEIDTTGRSSGGNTDLFLNYRSGEDLKRGIMKYLGWDGSSPVDQGSLAISGSGGQDTFWIFRDGYLYGFQGVIGGQGSVILANIDQASNPSSLGYDYLGRIEEGSTIESQGYGARDFYYGVGKAGTLYGETDYELETTEPWIERSCYELVRTYFRDHSYTGATRTLGTQTLLGDRGWCKDDDDLLDYITSYTGKTPLLSCRATAVNGDGIITWKHPASKYRTNITGIKIYLDGSLAGTVAANAYGMKIPGLAVGHNFKVQCAVVDSVTGEGGLSNPVYITA
ncbi:MAG: hypothetical protein JKY67_08535 [Pseudomonadales bacterium]|nr:hypothetical protein [Pseudomonadales bacterium]